MSDTASDQVDATSPVPPPPGAPEAADDQDPDGDEEAPGAEGPDPTGDGEDPGGDAHDPDTPDGDTSATPTAPTGEFKMAVVSAVNVDLPNQHPTVILREIESPRRQLSFAIGLQDGVVLSHALRRIPTPRPLTHELTTGILQGFDIDVVAVRLVGRQGAVYFAELDLRGRTARSVLACRPSDGLTLALLQPVPVPILIDRRLFEEAGDVTPGGAAPPPPD